MDRMKRRWSVFTPQDVQAMVDRATPETMRGSIPTIYKPELSEKLNGMELRLEFDGKASWVYQIADSTHLRWSKGGEMHEELCEVFLLPGTGDVFFINHFCAGSAPGEQHSLVLDLTAGTAAMVVARIGNPEAAREVSREFLFGTVQGLYTGGAVPCFTDELIGKSIIWTYAPQFEIKHIYSMPLYYSYVMKFQDVCWMASNPADYVKIRDGVYIFSFVEERQAGVQGLFVINLDEMHDVGSFFGVQASGMECYTFGAKGEYAEPYTFFDGEGQING